MKKWLAGVLLFAGFLVVCLILYRTLAGEYRPDSQLATLAETGEATADRQESMGVAEESGVPETVAVETSVAETEGNTSEGETAAGSESSEEAPSDSKAPDFRFSDETGEEQTLYEVLKEGKPVILNFWASWCGPCKSEMPEFQKLYEEKGDEIRFLMVNLTDGGQETMETAQAFLEESGYTFPVYYDLWQEAASQYYVFSIPMTFFINPDGTLEAYARGAMDEETLRQGVEMLE